MEEKETQKDCADYVPTVKGECLHIEMGRCMENFVPCPYSHTFPQGFSLRQKELADWQDRNFPKSLYNGMSRDDLIDRIRVLELSVGMAEEVGELSQVILKASQKIRNGVSGDIDKDLVADGFSDSVIFGIQLMTKIGIDAEKVLKDTISSVLKRDWASDRKGGALPIDGENQLDDIKLVDLRYPIMESATRRSPIKALQSYGIRYHSCERLMDSEEYIFRNCIITGGEIPEGFTVIIPTK